MISQTKTANRLAKEISPYLLQHAHNPVDWYPWGEEAFLRAERENKPVFLSIGYATCHWCHVMEREVFENTEAAEALNRDFICVKVDREERPDVDHLYMETCQALTGSGGWPLSVFMTPDKKPFFAGTYFPCPSFMDIIRHISGMWQKEQDQLFAAAEDIMRWLSEHDRHGDGTVWDDNAVHAAFSDLADSFDQEYGGFGSAPKFPSPHTLMFLFRYGLRYNNDEACEMARHTLTRMYLGGMHDHIGGGFCRYSTDRAYLVPHFEKMLYDNALLAVAYAEAGMDKIARETIDFCLRTMQAPEGGFYSAIDADSEGVEGKFYGFTPRDIIDALGEEDAKRFMRLYGITEAGHFDGLSIPNLIKTGMLSGFNEEFAAPCRERLRQYQKKRVPPVTDNKIPLGSNGLMIAALATCGRLLQEDHYIHEAIRAARFIISNMLRDGRFYSTYRERLGDSPATSDDYAYLAWGLYRLHQATLHDMWLHLCRSVCEDMLELFREDDGLLRLAGKDVEDLPIRGASTFDGAAPSGNSIAAGVFLRLYSLLGEEKYLDAYKGITESVAGHARAVPTAFTSLMSAAILYEHGAVHVELPGGDEDMRQVSEEFYPFASFHDGGGAEAVVCVKNACLPPLKDAKALGDLLSDYEASPVR